MELNVTFTQHTVLSNAGSRHMNQNRAIKKMPYWTNAKCACSHSIGRDQWECIISLLTSRTIENLLFVYFSLLLTHLFFKPGFEVLTHL